MQVTNPNGQSATVEARMFAGAKEVGTIQAYERNEPKIRQFDLLIDWGWFYFITKPMFYLIDWLYRLLGNFGLAILATQRSGEARTLRRVADYSMPNVSDKVLRIVHSYTDYVNRTVWRK